MKALETIESARLVLQCPQHQDAESIFTMYASDPVVTRYLAWPRHESLADTEAFLAFSKAEWIANSSDLGKAIVDNFRARVKKRFQGK